MQGRWDPDGLGLRPVCDSGASEAAKGRYLTMVSISAAAALALPTAFVFCPPLALPPGWVAEELYWPAVSCTSLSSVASVLLLLAAVRNSPPLLLAAGAVAVAVLTTGIAGLFPAFPTIFASVMMSACGFIAKFLVQLSLGAPLLYAALVGVSAATTAVGMLRVDHNMGRRHPRTRSKRRFCAGTEASEVMAITTEPSL